ncbi:hypothetical protein QQY24_31925 [Streptomyces sp. TG1A-8]|uniref:hypothetical protein n=1 Tax=Streptomyces sp. TG1A-8 TaxID=3051385 RepID=UPI00265C7445|nr:hypothetical protein [Streptomyces sp. TG1A-8]MDO0929735.1 hypothetical protein [Streptomyces sp. TG1A-8]
MRLSAAEIVTELLSALGDDGWLTTSTAPAGPGPVAASAGLGDIVQAFRAHCRTGALPPAATRELERAANAAVRAQALEDANDPVALYGELGISLAYLVQARGACMDQGLPSLPLRKNATLTSSPGGERISQ